MLNYFRRFGAFVPLESAQLSEPFNELPRQLYRGGPLILTPDANCASTILEEAARVSTWSVRSQATTHTLERSTVKMLADLPNATSEQILTVAEDVCRCARTLLRYHPGSDVTINLASIFPGQDSHGESFALSGFHLDRSPCRLVRAYVGPGTEWLEPQRVDSEKFHAYFKSGRETDFANPIDIKQIPTGDIVMFHGPSFIHRRPSFPGPRVFLAIDLR